MSANTLSERAPVTLCIDCDGTLLKTDLLHESLLLLVKQSPWSLLRLPLWLLRGKAYFKQRIAERVQFNWETLPICDDVVAVIRMARDQGRRVVLATASPRAWAEGVASHLGLFDEVLATDDEQINLAGAQKGQQLAQRYGERGFDYAGNSRSDLDVWRHAQRAIVVSSSASLIRSARSVSTVDMVIEPRSAGLLTYVKALRVHQWLKNLLVWVPLFAAHRVHTIDGFVQAALAFFAFSFCASTVYIINDLLDLESDRQHVRKRKRPFASAAIALSHAVLMVPVLLVLTVLLACQLPTGFSLVLAAYFAMTLAYSLRLKRQVIVDVLLLAALYTMRIIAGAAATHVVPSFWLLALSMFGFLSLAIVKRYSEMWVLLQQGKQTAAGRGYSINDLSVLMSLGASAGMAAVLVLALYINDPETRRLYPNTMWLWLVPPVLLYWFSRIWMKSQRGEVDDDPVVFAARDWQSIVVVLLIALLFGLASARGVTL